jgi:biotin synthase
LEENRKRNKKMIYLCAISNISSGNCSEDCKFCTQSAHYNTNINTYKQKSIDEIIIEAKKAKQNKAVGFCLVTAGKGLNDKKLEYVCKVAYAVKKEVDISLIGCNGTASIEQLKELKKAGIENYNHNLETSKQFYPSICTTHTWEERFQTCLNVKEIGLNLCTGGILGLGESEKDRYSMLKSIKELNPMSIPLNFYIPNNNLPIKNTQITKDEALFWIKEYRKTINSMLMIAGGRELIFGNDWIEAIKAGANSIVIGDYLTTKGEKINKDLEILQKHGYEIAKECNG